MIFIDTDLSIAFLSSKKTEKSKVAKQVMKELFDQEESIHLTIFNYAELLRGAYISKKVAYNTRIVNEFASRMKIVGFDLKTVENYSRINAELKQMGQSIGDFDELIASTVIEHKGELYSHNLQHFERIKLLNLIDWFPLDPHLLV